jgi:cytochrome oxidase Cu insertion factor (SCO1/SenC/PrrC family)
MKVRIAVAAALAVALAGTATATVLVSRDRSGGPVIAGSRAPSGETLPAFRLQDQHGEVVNSRDLAGQAVLVTFLDSQCGDTCPIVALQVSEGLRRLAPEERAQVVALAISTDPTGDTAASVESFLREQRADTHLRYLLGTEAELRPVWRDFHILSSFDSGDDELHSAPVRLFDRQRVWRSTLHAGADLTPENLAHDLRALLE